MKDVRLRESQHLGLYVNDSTLRLGLGSPSLPLN